MYEIHIGDSLHKVQCGINENISQQTQGYIKTLGAIGDDYYCLVPMKGEDHGVISQEILTLFKKNMSTAKHVFNVDVKNGLIYLYFRCNGCTNSPSTDFEKDIIRKIFNELKDSLVAYRGKYKIQIDVEPIFYKKSYPAGLERLTTLDEIQKAIDWLL